MKKENKDFRFIKKGEIGYFVSCELERLGWLVHAFTTRWGGMSPFPEKALNLSFSTADRRENVIGNRQKLLRALNIPDDFLLTIKQSHSDKVILLDKSINPQKEHGIAADALVTDRSSIALAVQVADCYPILLIDIKKRVIANIHAGWRGALKGIVRNTLKAMEDHFDCQAKDLLAIIGPGIGKCCYEVGREVIERFQKLAPQGSIFWQQTSMGSYFLDLLGILKSQFFLQGLVIKQIKSLELCTSCHLNLFFSYRKEGKDSGRMMAIVLKN